MNTEGRKVGFGSTRHTLSMPSSLGLKEIALASADISPENWKRSIKPEHKAIVTHGWARAGHGSKRLTPAVRVRGKAICKHLVANPGLWDVFGSLARKTIKTAHLVFVHGVN